jgi:hypothetical protein
MKRRSLYVLLKILHADGICAAARIAHGKLYVSIDGPSDTELPWTRIFETSETRRAADWLSDCAVSLYPMSALAKVRRLVAEAIAALLRNSRSRS